MFSVREYAIVAFGALMGAAGVVAYQSQAQVRIGAALGGGRTYAPTHYSNVDVNMKDASAVAQVFAEGRYKHIGIEAGYLALPAYHGHAHTDDYPAYKGLAPGTYPQVADAQQDITANATYARLNVYAGPVYGFLGKAKVRTFNHEHATYNGTDEADYQERIVRTANYFGLGVEHAFGSWSVRAEIAKIPHAAFDYHTGDRTVTMAMAGISYSF